MLLSKGVVGTPTLATSGGETPPAKWILLNGIEL